VTESTLPPVGLGENDWEKASNSYLMSLMFIMIGLPLPLINLIASFIYFLNNRRASHYARWHCLQAVLSQLAGVFMNSIGIYWTLSIVFGSKSLSNPYIAYLLTLLFFNAIEYIATIYAAIRTRKGFHVEWWVFGSLTNLLCRR